MPVCFQLTRKGFTEPTTFQDIDNELCQNLSLSWDTDKYVCSWYDSIGLRLALGKSWDAIVDEFKDDLATAEPFYHPWLINIIRISTYLRENYVSSNWRER